MRISDWSSDVCSSDLVGDAGNLYGRLGEQAHQHGGGLDHHAEQHRQRLIAGRQRRQDIHMGARVHLSAQRNEARLQLVVRLRSEEHTSELQSLMRISYAVFCLQKNNRLNSLHQSTTTTHVSSYTTPPQTYKQTE